MYTLSNTTASILRGTAVDDYGDSVDSPTVIASGIPAFISSPSMSPFRPIILGTTTYMPGTVMPSVVREILCVLPANTDVQNTDQILDEKTGIVYAIIIVTQLGSIGGGGLAPDMQLTLERVTTFESA